MKRKLLLTAITVCTTIFTNAQNATPTYAITGKANNNFLWTDIKQIDISTGKVNKVVFESDKTAFKTINSDNAAIVQRSGEVANPTGFGVAACALDARHNRLYFAPMHFSDIRFLDLSKPDLSFTTIKKNIIASPVKGGFQPEENHITRMVIAADGYGYALTNDANHLIKFSTDKNVMVEDLGNLADAESNQGISIHNKCTSWGGDMVADAFGKLVVISANHNVFFVDTKTRIATHKGTITGLPVNFSTNGAAVDDDGLLVVSSANVFEGLYKINMKDLVAVKIQSSEAPFNASDLANGNLLSQKEANDMVRFQYIKSPVLPGVNGEAKLYPNPLTGTQFNVEFDSKPAGTYTIMLTDLAGKVLQSKVVSISKSGQVASVRISGKVAKGMYMVKVLNANRQMAFSEKMVIE